MMSDDTPRFPRFVFLTLLLYFLIVFTFCCNDGALTFARCPMISRPCGPASIGECIQGVQRCDPATGAFGACEGANWGSGQEVCDGRDNDCDGAVDNRIARWTIQCGEFRGACGLTEPVCLDQTEVCTTSIPPEPEFAVCDGIDNDCDGETDEGIIVPCYTGPTGTAGVGVCHRGVQRCGDPACYFEVTPLPETACDGLDTDCDGSADLCCPTGGETCNGLDDDCDGETDEGLAQICNGVTFCPGEGPEEIPCDGIDNDCNGVTDEGEALTVNAGLCIDTSGSNCARVAAQAAALSAAVLDVGAEMPCSLFTVCSFPVRSGIVARRLTPDAGVPAADAAAALSTITCAGDGSEYSYDVAVEQAGFNLTPAPRSVVMVADEPGQTTTGLTEMNTSATVTSVNAMVFTFTENPTDYDALGPTAPADANDIAIRAREFLKGRAGP